MTSLTIVMFVMAHLLATPAKSTHAPETLPAFIVMYGLWESVAVRADPEEILTAMPQLTVPHEIRGRPASVCPGIRFEVEQRVGSEVMRTELSYAYAAASSKSIGILHSSDGTLLRAVILHREDADLLTLTNVQGEEVWTETKVWTSADEFHSEATFPYQGGPGRVWFVTRRVGAGQAEYPGSCKGD